MDLLKLEQFGKSCKNRYAAILIASKEARKLNLQRLAEGENIEHKKDKVTVEAIDALLDGKIKYEYPSTNTQPGE